MSGDEALRSRRKEGAVVRRAQEVTPELVGGTIGSFLGGPLGTVVGLGLTHAVHEVLSRLLSRRQEDRAEVVLSVAQERIRELHDEGHEPRQDGFFDDRAEKRADWEEVAEGTLISAMNDYEEKKARFYGYLIANIVFDDKVDRGMAHSLLRLGQQLSYRQLCLLALVEQKDQQPLPKERRTSNVDWATWAVQRDLDELGYGRMELVQVAPREGERLPTNIGVPADLILASGGVALSVLMELSRIERKDLRELADLLNR